MFQSFDSTTTPETGAERLKSLRNELTKDGLDGFLVPRADAHQGEYVVAHDMRLAWLTGFTGSAGFCAVLHDKAGIFIDGRYTLQVRDQVDLDCFTPVPWPETRLENWLPKSGKIGFDPWVHTRAEIEKLTNAGITPVAVGNLIDKIWLDQPDAPLGKMLPHPLKYAGQPHGEKIASAATELTDAKHSAFVLTQPDSIAWLLNTRGTDLGQTPVALAFAILHGSSGHVSLFMDSRKSDATLIDHLGPKVSLHAPGDFELALAALSGTVRLDKSTAPEAIVRLLERQNIDIAFADDPTCLPKACKNPVELEGTKQAHIRDGAALCEFLAWVDQINPETGITEIDVVKTLEAKRAATGKLKNISFDTICGSGPNGAIVHYRVTDKTNRRLQFNEVLLVDSGAQYMDGTTDITRTMAIGTPPPKAVHQATLVLKGMIAISRLRFPDGLSGRDIDAFARAPLWVEGLDFDHGTGHGVGSYLSVHEGPQRISRAGMTPLKPGMIVSNEPGYYKQDAYGIRLENLIYVRQADPVMGSDDRDMLCFDTLTLAPFDRAMIDTSLLTADELAWLNAYHQQVWDSLQGKVSAKTKDWLKAACAAL
ncbi:MAG: aminopeptidase P family protein [Rhodobacterales bacterium]